MTDPHLPGSPTKLTTSQVSLILQRAAEIDARGDTLSMEELERIATEAGIDARATRTAIAEFIAAEMPAQPPPASGPGLPARRSWKPKPPSPLLILAGAGVGTAYGLMLTISQPAAMLGFGGSVLYLVLRAVQSMKRGDQLGFQLQNFSLWLGTLVSGLAAGVPDEESFTVGILFLWAVLSFLAGLLVRFGPRDPEPDEDFPRIESGGR